MNEQLASAGAIGAWGAAGLWLAQAISPLSNEIPAWVESGGTLAMLAVLCWLVRDLLRQRDQQANAIEALKVEHERDLAAADKRAADRIDLIRQSQLEDRKEMTQQIKEMTQQIEAIRAQNAEERRELLARLLGGPRPKPGGMS